MAVFGSGLLGPGLLGPGLPGSSDLGTLDPVVLAEIDLLADVMIAANGALGPLGPGELDRALGLVSTAALVPV